MKWTDADVARMLGWKTIYDHGEQVAYVKEDDTTSKGFWVFGGFGLSTPPGPEADSNAARYVLPWLVTQKHRAIYMLRLHSRLRNDHLNAAKERPDDWGSFEWFLLTLDSPTLCTAALEAASDE